MRNHQDPDPTPEGAALARRAAERWLRETDLIRLALIAVETGEPLDHIAHLFAGDVVLDDVGMRAVTAAAARRFFTERAEQTARMQEQSRRMQEEAARRSQPVRAGIPALSNASPLASIQAADPSYMTVEQEFGRGGVSVHQALLDEQLIESQRQRAEEVAARKAVKEAKRALEGK